MSLIARWRRPDTIWEFEQAVRSRRRDAMRLKEGPRTYWGIYTLGYAAEMLLKAAYFRITGVREIDDLKLELSKKTLQNRAALGGSLQPAASNLHDLLFWTHLLVAERAASGRPLPVDVANGLMASSQRVANHWVESMRYWRSTAATSEYNEVLGAVIWLTQNYAVLWS